MFSLDYCPRCGQGLCGVRICGIQDEKPHGLVVCDECEAIWTEPNLQSSHQYPDSRESKCPICARALWGSESRWADWEDIKRLGWQTLIDPGLIWDEDRPWTPSDAFPDRLDPPSTDRTEWA